MSNITVKSGTQQFMPWLWDEWTERNTDYTRKKNFWQWKKLHTDAWCCTHNVLVKFTHQRETCTLHYLKQLIAKLNSPTDIAWRDSTVMPWRDKVIGEFKLMASEGCPESLWEKLAWYKKLYESAIQRWVSEVPRASSITAAVIQPNSMLRILQVYRCSFIDV